MLIYIYLIVTFITIVVGSRCLRNKFEGIIPVCTVSCLISSIITCLISIIMFFAMQGSLETVKTIKSRRVLEIDYKKNKLKFKDYPSMNFSSIDEIHLTNISRPVLVTTTEYKKNNIFSSKYFFEPETFHMHHYTLNVNSKDYELLKSYKDNDK